MENAIADLSHWERAWIPVISHCTGLAHSHETQKRGGSSCVTDNLLSSLQKQWVSCTFWMWIRTEILSKTTVLCLYHFLVYACLWPLKMFLNTLTWYHAVFIWKCHKLLIKLNSGSNQSHRLIYFHVQWNGLTMQGI